MSKGKCVSASKQFEFEYKGKEYFITQTFEDGICNDEIVTCSEELVHDEDEILEAFRAAMEAGEIELG